MGAEIGLDQIAVRLAVATMLGAIVGLERERHETAAGLRTHALVSLGAAVFMLVSIYGFTGSTHDPSRLAAQVASGIGFLGAGTIILRQELIRGLTTAASIWTVAAIGLAAGGGFFAPAVVATIFVLAVLAAMKVLENRLFRNRGHIEVSLVLDPRTFDEEAVRRIVADSSAKIETLGLRYDNAAGEDHAHLTIRECPREKMQTLTSSLREVAGVRQVHALEEINR